MGKLADKFNGLLNKVDTTELQYEKALERLQGELMQVDAELTAKLADTRELKKMIILGEVTLETFAVEQEKLDAIQAKKSAILENIRLTELFKTEDVDSVLEELKDTKGKYLKEEFEEISKLRIEMMEAKKAYLQTLMDVSERYQKIIAPDKKLADLLVSKGKKSNVYTQDVAEALNMFTLHSGGVTNLQVDYPMVYQAINYKKEPHEIASALKHLQKK
ncbi:hypothetical protein ACSFXN_19555 [Planococcus sp. 1R117A]|uniref:hypothetical protein n=1 Tax=Planococcus sp. 1R117A TaxID=3447020 RepID=UPI003EDC204D